MPIYRAASQEMHDVLQQELELDHARLIDVEVAIDVLAAWPKTDEAGEPMEPALKLAGYACLATIKIRGPKDRAEGRGDALLMLDGYRWDELDAGEKRALIDHELTHLELDVDGKGNLKRDDYSRPKLKIRLHDHQFGWFDMVAARHGENSQEVQQANRFREASGQLYFTFEQAEEGERGRGGEGESHGALVEPVADGALAEPVAHKTNAHNKPAKGRRRREVTV